VLLEQEVEVIGQTGAEIRRSKGWWKWLVSFPAVLIAGLALVGVATVSKRFTDPDLWFHLKMGQIIWTTHSAPSTDLFSFTTQGHARAAHEWLAQAFIYWAYRMGGYSGLMLWLASLTALLLVLLYFLCYRYSGNVLVSFLGAMCGWLFATVGLSLRPLLLGHVFLAIELLLLEHGVRNRRCLWVLPPLFAVWVNCHGSWFFGIGVLFTYWICSFARGKWGLIVAEPWNPEQRRWLGLAAILSVCACAGIAFVGPVGVQLLLHPLSSLLHQHTGPSLVEEWMPPDLRSIRALAMIGAVVSILVIPLVRRSELRLQEILLVAMAFGLALQHVRMLLVFGIVMSPVLCRVLAPVIGESRKREHPVLNASLVAACLAAMIWLFPRPAGIQEQITRGNPAGAVDFVRRTQLTGPMLNEYVFGDYLVWAMPEEKVFIDGDGDDDPTGVFQEFARWATMAEDPNLLPDKHGIRFCVLAAGNPIARVMPHLGWRRVYADEVAQVLVR